MPLLVEPSPSLPAARFGAPDEAQEASYLAASASTRSFCCSFSSTTAYLSSQGKSGGRRINGCGNFCRDRAPVRGYAQRLAEASCQPQLDLIGAPTDRDGRVGILAGEIDIGISGTVNLTRGA